MITDTRTLVKARIPNTDYIFTLESPNGGKGTAADMLHFMARYGFTETLSVIEERRLPLPTAEGEIGYLV